MSDPSPFESLLHHGYQVFDTLLPKDMVERLAVDCRALEMDGRLQPARVGRAAGSVLNAGIRGDSTRWIEADEQAPVRGAFLGELDALRGRLNQSLLLGLASVEAHYAAYPPGTGYRRHRDRFRDDDARVLSFTCYLNPDWDQADGGALRLWLDSGPMDVLPQLGTCCLFLSDEIEHEVLPARQTRYSIAGWFRRRESRVV